MNTGPLLSCLGAGVWCLLSSLGWLLTDWPTVRNSSQSRSHIATDGQSVSKSWCRAPVFITLTVTVLFSWGALSDERTSLSFAYAAGPCQRSHSRVRVPWNSRPYFLSQMWDFPLRRLLRLAGSRWRYSTPPPHGSVWGVLSSIRNLKTRHAVVTRDPSNMDFLLHKKNLSNNKYTNFCIYSIVNRSLATQN
jgi:hypothetical protein